MSSGLRGRPGGALGWIGVGRRVVGGVDSWGWKGRGFCYYWTVRW